MNTAVAPPVMARRNTFSSFSAAAAVAVPSQQRVSSFPTALPQPRFDFDFGSLSSVYYTSLKDLIPPPPPPAAAASRTLSGECEAVPERSGGVEGCWRGRRKEGGGGCLRRLWVGLVVEPVRACVRFFNRMVLPGISRFAGWIRR